MLEKNLTEKSGIIVLVLIFWQNTARKIYNMQKTTYVFAIFSSHCLLNADTWVITWMISFFIVRDPFLSSTVFLMSCIVSAASLLTRMMVMMMVVMTSSTT